MGGVESGEGEIVRNGAGVGNEFTSEGVILYKIPALTGVALVHC